MAINLAPKVKRANDYVAERLGSSITYYRWQGESYHPETGIARRWWEETGMTATALNVSEGEIENSAGRVQIGDVAFTFRKDAFADHSSYEYLSFTNGSVEFTVGEVVTGVVSGATGTVVNWYESSGTYAAGTAAGVLWVSGRTGTFQLENIAGSVTGVAKASGASASGGTDNLEPHPGDEITYGGSTWKLDLGSNDMVWQIDATNTMYRVFARRIT